MMQIARNLLLPAFLLACLVLGGSAQSIWGKMVLHLGAVLLLAWAAISRSGRLSPSSRQLLGLALIFMLVLLVQLIPLPPELWTALPGRDVIASGYRALGKELPWLPLSLTPYATLQAVLASLPPLAILAVVFRTDAVRVSWAVAALIAGTVAGIFLGYLQIGSGRYGETSWYLYDFTNVGSAVGFFANRNHMGTLLLLVIPFAVALFVGRAEQSPTRSVPLLVAGAVTGVLLVAGLALNGSLAAVVLALPVVIASALLVPGAGRFRVIGLSLAAMAAIAAILVLTNSPVQAEIAGTDTASIDGRRDHWAITVEAIRATFPAGTGAGSFEPLFALYEDASAVGRTYVNHAHNDYLEMVLEMGAAGALLILLFLAWWARQAVYLWRTAETSRFALAATIASGAVLAHSIVDYPLRTAAIASAFALSVAIMAGASGLRGSHDTAARLDRARHVKLA